MVHGWLSEGQNSKPGTSSNRWLIALPQNSPEKLFPAKI